MWMKLKLALKAAYRRRLRDSAQPIRPPKQWITNGSEVQQTPDGPTVVWSVNGSNVSYTEV